MTKNYALIFLSVIFLSKCAALDLLGTKNKPILFQATNHLPKGAAATVPASVCVLARPNRVYSFNLSANAAFSFFSLGGMTAWQ